MQTFLPYPSFEETARVLDYERLGKQRVETMQIMGRLLQVRLSTNGPDGKLLPRDRWKFEPTKGNGWANHPAVLMWRGYEFALLMYQSAIVSEWEARGYQENVCMIKTSLIFQHNYHNDTGLEMYPPWLGDPDIHLGYQSNLIRKNPEFYGPLFPGVPGDLEYKWPVQAR